MLGSRLYTTIVYCQVNKQSCWLFHATRRMHMTMYNFLVITSFWPTNRANYDQSPYTNPLKHPAPLSIHYVDARADQHVKTPHYRPYWITTFTTMLNQNCSATETIIKPFAGTVKNPRVSNELEHSDGTVAGGGVMVGEREGGKSLLTHTRHPPVPQPKPKPV